MESKVGDSEIQPPRDHLLSRKVLSPYSSDNSQDSAISFHQIIAMKHTYRLMQKNLEKVDLFPTYRG